MSNNHNIDELIKAELIARWTELGLYSVTDKRSNIAQIIADAQERAPEMKITTDRLSKYLSGYAQKRPGKKTSTRWLSDKQVEWLATRYCLDVSTKVEVKPYNESKALRNLEKEFPK